MAKETERKFLVEGDGWRAAAGPGTAIVQGYLSAPGAQGATVRVRVAGRRAWLTVKGPNSGMVRDEWEYPVPVEDALQMLRLCPAPLEKTRYRLPGPREGLAWEIDVFGGRHSGLVLAEIELPEGAGPDCLAPADLPPFIGREVTGDPRYYNSSLASQP